MAGRSCMGWLASMATVFLRFINFVLLLGALTTIALLFVIKNLPTFPEGWGFIALGVVTSVSAMFGMISKGKYGCCGLHLLVALLSTAGLAVSALFIFVKPNDVLDAVKYEGSNRSNKKTLLLIVGAIFAVLLVLQLFLFLLSCLIQCCNWHDYYEDLEAPQPTAKQLAKERKVDDKRRAKIESTSAHKLGEQMREKYGTYNQDPQYQTQP